MTPQAAPEALGTTSAGAAGTNNRLRVLKCEYGRADRPHPGRSYGRQS
jgi:hypothetical protein